MKNKIEFEKSWIILVVIVVIIGVTVFLVLDRTRTDQITEMVDNGDEINIVILVHDGDKLLFTEILFYNPTTAKAALLDIPGETGVIIQKLGKIDRIDTIFEPGNPGEYISELENITDQEIPFYILMDISDVPDMIDVVEGLEMFIANPVEILEPGHTVLLPSGSIVLDGDKAETYLTYEDPEESDIDKSGRHEKFIQSLLKTFQDRGPELLNNRMFPYLYRTMETNIDRDSFRAFITESEKMDTGRIVFQRVLGVKRTVDDQVLLFRHYDGNLLKETVKQTVSSIANMEVVSTEELNIALQILNGTAVNGLASRTSQVFQSFGYDVANIGNYIGEIEKTLVINRGSDIAQAQRAANIIKCGNVLAGIEGIELPEDINEYEYDVIIILGKDFDGRYCKE